MTVRHAPRDIFVSVKFDPPGRVVLDRAHIWRNGIEVDLRPERILLVNNRNTVAGMVAERCQVGLAVGDPPEGLGGAIFMGSMRAPYPPDAATEGRVVKITSKPQDDDHEAIVEDFKSFLDDVSPEDFAI